MNAHAFWEKLSLLFFPRHCPICGKLTEGSEAAKLCDDCQLLFHAEAESRCPTCKKVARNCQCIPAHIGMDFSSVGGRRFLFVSFYRPGVRGLLNNRLLYALKDQNDDTAARILARELSGEILRRFLKSGEDPKNWIITFPPRTKKQKITKGFDQAERLARFIALYTGASFCPLFIRKGGRVQKQLSGTERYWNAQSSLHLRPGQDLTGARVILTDDVVTSGATLAVAARLLKEAGAETVVAAAVMRTVEK